MRMLGCLAIAACYAAPAAPAPVTADAIVADTIAMYARTTSYEDRGELTTTYVTHTTDSVNPNHLTFTTAFVRGGRFRFEAVDGSPYTVWTDGTHSYSRWRHSAEPGVHMDADLVTALRDAASVSYGLSTMIPSVLLRGESGAAWLSTLRLRVDGSETIDGAPCWRLTGTNAHAEAIALWIDQHTHAIRRDVEHHRMHDGTDVTATASFAPIVGQPIELAKLATPLPDGPEMSWIGIAFDATASPARIAQVVDDSPASRAQLLAGDVITAIDNDAMPTVSDAATRIREAKVGTRLLIAIARGTQTRSVVVMTENRPYMEQVARERLLDKPAPDFALPVVAGAYPATRAELAGKVIVLAFGSSQCASCATTFATLDGWQAAYGSRGLRIVFVSGESHDAIVDLARASHVGFTMAQDPGDKVVIAYMRLELPALVVIDKRGIVRRVDAYAETPDVETAIVRLLDERSDRAK